MLPARGGGGGGKAVQVAPMNPMLKPPENKRLTLKYDLLLLSFAFNFNLRRYTEAVEMYCRADRWEHAHKAGSLLTVYRYSYRWCSPHHHPHSTCHSVNNVHTAGLGGLAPTPATSSNTSYTFDSRVD